MKTSKVIVIAVSILIFISILIGVKVRAWVAGVSHPAHEIFGDNTGLTEDATFPDLYYYFEQNLEAFGQVTAGTKFYVGGAEFTSAGIGQTGASNFALKTSNIDRVTVDSNGNVGIGIGTPSQLLHLRQDIAEGPMIRLDKTANPNVDDVAILGVAYWLPGGTTTDSFWIGRGTADADKKFVLRLNSGYLGLGTVSPSYQLSIADTSGSQAGFLMSPTAPPGLSGFLAFYGSGRTPGTDQPNLVIAPQSYAACRGCIGVNKTQPVSSTLDVEGTVTAVSFVGDGSGLTGIGSGTGGIINTGSTTIGADSDANGTGDIALQVGGNTRMMIKSYGRIGIVPDTARAFNDPTRTLCIGSQTTCIDNGYDPAVGSPVWPTDLQLDTFAFITNNTERMRITSSGAVGLGTNSPNAQLDIRAPALTQGLYLNTTETTSAYYIANFSSGGVSRLYVRADGYVGVGTNTPGQILDVAGYARAQRFEDRDNTGYYLDPASTSYLATVYGTNAYWNIYYDRNNSAYYADPASTSVLNNLTVSGTGSFTNPVTVGEPTLASHAATKNYVDTRLPGGVATNSQACSADATCETNDITASGVGTFNGAGNNYFAGNVGIGVVPSSKLDVAGSIYSTDQVTSSTLLVSGNVRFSNLLTCSTLGTDGSGNLQCVANNVTGSGTNGNIVKWTGSNTTGDSIMSESAGNLYVNGGMQLNSGIRINATGGAGKPACDATIRGTLWFTQGGAGVKDVLEVCAKDATDTYAWRNIW